MFVLSLSFAWQERWIYMPLGRLVQADEYTAEQTSVKAKKEGGRGMLDALTGEDGVLPNGACPAVMAATAEGQKAIMQALDDDKKAVKTRPKVKKVKGDEDQEAQKVVPKTLQEPWPQHYC